MYASAVRCAWWLCLTSTTPPTFFSLPSALMIPASVGPLGAGVFLNAMVIGASLILPLALIHCLSLFVSGFPAFRIMHLTLSNGVSSVLPILPGLLYEPPSPNPSGGHTTSV